MAREARRETRTICYHRGQKGKEVWLCEGTLLPLGETAGYANNDLEGQAGERLEILDPGEGLELH
ncbi:hypothetical protein P7K49_030550 [Saguinus oedipus]|uniref:Uncharacterized protein n=1 Tax=Saguinus oedipus TaxID=9490 RepID=A0ABQ9U378_SAGOE|nr:hypothetical protein P7K49_030550 [Saguinus oedipus]